MVVVARMLVMPMPPLPRRSAEEELAEDEHEEASGADEALALAELRDETVDARGHR